MKNLNRSLTIFTSFSFLYLSFLQTFEILLNKDKTTNLTEILKALQYCICGIFFMISVCGSQRFTNNFGFTNVSWLKGIIISFLGLLLLQNEKKIYHYFAFLIIVVGLIMIIFNFCENKSKKRNLEYYIN